MDILFETMITTPFAGALISIGIIMGLIGLVIGFAESIESEKLTKKVAIWFAVAALGWAMVIVGNSLPMTRRVYALPEEGFCFMDYKNYYNLVEQKGKSLSWTARINTPL